jgi:hypothetical protein
MARVLDVARTKVNEALQEVMGRGIAFRVKRGICRFNPPHFYRVAEFIPGTETMDAQYIRADQYEAIAKIRWDESLPDLMRFPRWSGCARRSSGCARNGRRCVLGAATSGLSRRRRETEQ